MGFDLIDGASARAVARDIFLDGNTFQNGLRVGHEPFVQIGRSRESSFLSCASA